MVEITVEPSERSGLRKKCKFSKDEVNALLLNADSRVRTSKHYVNRFQIGVILKKKKRCIQNKRNHIKVKLNWI